MQVERELIVGQLWICDEAALKWRASLNIIFGSLRSLKVSDRKHLQLRNWNPLVYVHVVGCLVYRLMKGFKEAQTQQAPQ